MKNYYLILGIPPTATDEEIKSARRRCARVAHPDHSGSVADFLAIQEAYSVLGVPENRTKYDQERRVWMNKIGAVQCHMCGSANRITHRPEPGEVARCASCKATLRISLNDLMAAQRQSLVNEAARFIDEVGIDLAALATDAVKSGIGKIRTRFGLDRAEKVPKIKP